MDNYIGLKLDGRYELLELIGTGGMAEIYKADDTVEDKTVAVKILKNEFAGSEEFLRRFRNESKAIALLSHPNIVKIFDVGFTENVQFIVMEYIDGITLIDYIERQGVLKWREALGFTRQILKALQHAHDRGIVHRDIKSQNVMLLRDGTIKVMDFGIARFNREINKTMTEKAIGSVHYISPEQARGGITDEKSDLYSVGVMLYEMLTGIKPFDGDDALAIALMHTNKSPKPPTEVNSAIPEGFEEITLRAMQKETAKRYQTAGEMLEDLKELERNPSVIFEYKYSMPDGNTKHFDKIGKAVPPNMQDNNPVPIEPEFDDDGEDYDDDEVIERRSPLLPILFAVASAFVIITAVLIATIFGDLFGDGNTLFGNRNREMPDLFGMDYHEAGRAYDWLQLEPQEEYSDDYAKNTIIEQDVAAGSMFNPSQQTVKVVVSSGKRVIYFPDFTNRMPILGSVVMQELNDLGLKPTQLEAFHDDIPAGYYIKSDRMANDELEVGDTVRVTISRGAEEPVDTVVPNFVGVSINTARELAQTHRLVLKETPKEAPDTDPGRIVEQSMPPDTRVPNNSVVEVFVSIAPATEEEQTEPQEDDEPPSDSGRESIALKFANARTGSYEFIRYIDGEAVFSHTINLSIVKDYVWEIEGDGKHLYSIGILNPRTNKEGIIVSYEIDFTQDPPAKVRTHNDPLVFNDLE